MADKKTWKNYGGTKDVTIRARVDADTVDKLDKSCEALETTRSDVIRKGIEKVFDEVSKEK